MICWCFDGYLINEVSLMSLLVDDLILSDLTINSWHRFRGRKVPCLHYVYLIYLVHNDAYHWWCCWRYSCYWIFYGEVDDIEATLSYLTYWWWVVVVRCLWCISYMFYDSCWWLSWYYWGTLVLVINVIYVSLYKGHVKTYDVIVVILSHVWTIGVKTIMNVIPFLGGWCNNEVKYVTPFGLGVLCKFLSLVIVKFIFSWVIESFQLFQKFEHVLKGSMINV